MSCSLLYFSPSSSKRGGVRERLWGLAAQHGKTTTQKSAAEVAHKVVQQSFPRSLAVMSDLWWLAKEFLCLQGYVKVVLWQCNVVLEVVLPFYTSVTSFLHPEEKL